MTARLLTVNAGSATLKFALFDFEHDGPALCSGRIETSDGAGGFGAILAWLKREAPGARISAVGHRIVHGGADFAAPIAIDDAVLARLEALSPLAPLHQPHNLAGVRAARAAFPNAIQVACFDTAFHRTHERIEELYALPRDLFEEGVRRYGFHGLSYEYIARTLRETEPDLSEGRVIVAHLGSGASMCALRRGRSVATSMGFSALDGLPMGTRPGQLDPGVLLYLMTARGMDARALSDLLYRRSGLLGLSGISADMRMLENSTDARAAEAIAYFCRRATREIGALAAALGGLDALVFTGGIGENSARARREICASLDWLGIAIDEVANRDHRRHIHASGARTKALVIPTDEEAMIAAHARVLATERASLASR